MLRLPAAAAAALSPAALGEQALLVRRIVALEGDEMISDLPGDEPFVCVCVRPTLALHTLTSLTRDTAFGAASRRATRG